MAKAFSVTSETNLASGSFPQFPSQTIGQARGWGGGLGGAWGGCVTVRGQ